MDKVRQAKKRLSVGSWGPFASKDDKRSSRRLSGMSGKDGETLGGSTSDVPSTIPENNGTKEAENGQTQTVKSTTSLVELAKTIARETEKLEKYYKDIGHPLPGWEVDSSVDLPKFPDDIKKAREEVVKATKELEYLVTGPTESLRWMAWDVSLLYPRIN
jgi:hypothetical protein